MVTLDTLAPATLDELKVRRFIPALIAGNGKKN